MRKFVWLSNFQKQFWKQKKFEKKVTDFFAEKSFDSKKNNSGVFSKKNIGYFFAKKVPIFYSKKKFLLFFREKKFPIFFPEKKFPIFFRKKVSISDKYNSGVFSGK
jgi:hypothetical protein